MLKDNFQRLCFSYTLIILIATLLPIARPMGMENVSLIDSESIWVWAVLANAVALSAVHMIPSAINTRKIFGLIAGGFSAWMLLRLVIAAIKEGGEIRNGLRGLRGNQMEVSFGEAMEFLNAIMQPNWLTIAAVVIAWALGMIIGVKAFRLQTH